MVIRDGGGYIQTVLHKKNGAGNPHMKDLGKEASICISGSFHKDERAITGYELRINEFELIGKTDGIDELNEQSGAHALFEQRHIKR